MRSRHRRDRAAIAISIACLTCLPAACGQTHRPQREDPFWSDDIAVGSAGAAGTEPGLPRARGIAGGERIDPGAFAASESLGDALIQYWEAVARDDCSVHRERYGFGADARVLSSDFNEDRCAGRLLSYQAYGKYRLTGRQLVLALDAAELRETAGTTTREPGAVEEEMTIAIADRDLAGGDTQTLLDGRAYAGSDGVRFESLRRRVSYARQGGELETRREIALVVKLDRALHYVADGESVQVEVSASLAQLDPGQPNEESDELTLSYPATVRSRGWQQLVPLPLATLDDDPDAARDAWQRLLRDAGLEQHPPWAQRMIADELAPVLRYDRRDPTWLSSSLPDSGRWQQSARRGL